MSYAEVLLAIVRAAPPALKHHRATFRPAPAAANDPYVAGSRLTPRAFALVPGPAPPAIKAAPVAAFSALELAGMLASFILSSWVSALSGPSKRPRTLIAMHVLHRPVDRRSRQVYFRAYHSTTLGDSFTASTNRSSLGNVPNTSVVMESIVPFRYAPAAMLVQWF